MAKRDYYEVLGVQKNASPEEIKKAFRSRARHLHPDNKESGDEAAFKELAEAYEVLSDEQKRQTYNRYGHDGVKGAGRGFDNVDFSSFAGFGIDDIIDMFFGGGGGASGFRRSGGPEQGTHLKYDLEIDFLEAVFGTDKTVSVRRLEDCTACNGSGAAPGSTPVQCTTCAGMGQVKQLVNMFFAQTYQIVECPACAGRGQRIDKPCRDCTGHGLARKTREFQVKIPPGIEAGSRIRLTSAGDKGRRGGPFGDLFVIIHVREHKSFIREGDTIHLRQPLSFAMAALGGELSVPTVDGNKILKIPAGIQTGTRLVMREMGVPKFNNPQRRGDQIVHVLIETPTKLSSEERKLLEQFASMRGESLNLSKKQAEDSATKSETLNNNNQGSTAPGETKTDAPESSGKETRRERRAREHAKKKAKQDDKDESILEKIVDAFRPKNGEHETK